MNGKGQASGHLRTYSIPTRFSFLLIMPALILLTVVFVYPVTSFLVRSFTEPTVSLYQYVRLFSDPLYSLVIFRTIRIGGAVTAISVLVGYPIAMWVSRASPRVAWLVTVCVLIPLWTSVLVRSYGWILLLRRNGVINSVAQGLGLISNPLPMIYTEAAVIIAMTHVLLPFMILPLITALKTIPANLDRAAGSLGAGPVRTFLHVTLPLSLPAIFTGCILVFALSLGFYITPALLGGPRTLMIATLISQQATETLDWPFAGAISVVLLGLTLLITYGFRKLLRLGSGVIDV